MKNIMYPFYYIYNNNNNIFHNSCTEDLFMFFTSTNLLFLKITHAGTLIFGFLVFPLKYVLCISVLKSIFYFLSTLNIRHIIFHEPFSVVIFLNVYNQKLFSCRYMQILVVYFLNGP